jgi:hypothetical protein
MNTCQQPIVLQVNNTFQTLQLANCVKRVNTNLDLTRTSFALCVKKGKINELTKNSTTSKEGASSCYPITNNQLCGCELGLSLKYFICDVENCVDNGGALDAPVDNGESDNGEALDAPVDNGEALDAPVDNGEADNGEELDAPVDNGESDNGEALDAPVDNGEASEAPAAADEKSTSKAPAPKSAKTEAPAAAAPTSAKTEDPAATKVSSAQMNNPFFTFSMLFLALMMMV